MHAIKVTSIVQMAADIYCSNQLAFLGNTAEIKSANCNACYRNVVCPSVCMSSDTLVNPEWNDMPFGRKISVVPSNTVLDGALVPPCEWEMWGSKLPVCSNATYCQTTLSLVCVINKISS